jgi:hypothetical protein
MANLAVEFCSVANISVHFRGVLYTVSHVWGMRWVSASAAVIWQHSIIKLEVRRRRRTKSRHPPNLDPIYRSSSSSHSRLSPRTDTRTIRLHAPCRLPSTHAHLASELAVCALGRARLPMSHDYRPWNTPVIPPQDARAIPRVPRLIDCSADY